MKKNNKTINQRIFYGIKSGWDLPTFPNHIIMRYKNIYVRIFKMIGGLSVFIMVSGIGKQLNNIDVLCTTVFILSILYILYIIIFYSIKQWFYNLFKGNFLVSVDPSPKLDDHDINKSSIISFDFDLQTFLDSLSQEELLALGSLLFNSLVLSYVVSIILVLYGEYLIKRFDLENKYPKIAKFIEIRRKLQNYYLKLCFAWIFFALLPQFIIDILILYPKLLDVLCST